MKKMSVILVAMLIALIIVGVIGVVPLAIYSSANNFYNETIVDQASEYQKDLKGIASNEMLSKSLRNDVSNMYNVTDQVFLKVRVANFWMATYLVIAIVVLLIAVGVFFIKKEGCKNYVGTAFIMAACMLLAFNAIIGFFILK